MSRASTNLGRSLVMTRIGDRDYPLYSEPKCSTCQSPHRATIEAMIVQGSSYRSAAREAARLPHHDRPAPSHHSIANHVKTGHLPLPHAVQRKIIEKRAREVGKSVEEGDEPLADYLVVNQLIIQRGLAAMSEGKIDLKASDVIAASRFLHDVEREAVGDTDGQVWMEALMAYMEIAVEFIPIESRGAYGAALHASPVLRALAKRQQQQQQAIEGHLDEDAED